MLSAEEIGEAVAYALSRPGDVALENIEIKNVSGSL
jgi:NADP-dependent 3-hydroxy acid dehydrogenase YdfG